MSRHYQITIPVKPHIQKFIEAKEGMPLLSVNRSIIWKVIRPYLQYKVHDNRSHQQRQLKMIKLKGAIVIRVSMNKVKTYGITPRAGAVILISEFLDHYFAQELYWYVKVVETKEGRYKGFKKTIEEFATRYGIILDEDISFDALERMYRRHRENEKRNGSTNAVP